MIKKTVKYVDYNGQEQVEDLYFNLTKAELLEMQTSYPGGLAEHMQKVVDTKDSVELIKLFKDLLLKSYGKKSDDGKRFIKNQELRDEFVQTEAYSELFMELATNADSAAEFVNGIVPAGLVEEAKKLPTNN